jgi:hypothetical protein
VTDRKAARSRDLARLSAAREELNATLNALDMAVADRFPVELTGVYRHVGGTLGRALEQLERMKEVRAARRHTLDEALGGALTRLREAARR